MADLGKIKTHFREFASSLKETSFDEDNDEFLCNSQEQEGVYNFDNYMRQKFSESKTPKSFDALVIPKGYENIIICIEFKNQILSKIDMEEIRKKYESGTKELVEIFENYNLAIKEYVFEFFLICRNSIGGGEVHKFQDRFENNEKELGLKAWAEKHSNKILRQSIYNMNIKRIQEAKENYKKYFNADC